MIVACPKCDKKFKLDDEKLKAGPVKLKCTGCTTVFEVQAPKAAATLYRVRTSSGTELDNVTLDDLKKKVLTGQLAPDDMVAGPGEPMSPAGEHPDLHSLKFLKKPKPKAADDDLFGSPAGGDEDLFGSPDSDGGSDDDLFGSPKSAASSGKAPAQDDDLFGGSSASGGDDDLFGTSGSKGGDDDLFGSPAPAPAAPKSAAKKSAPPPPADDDLFGDSSASGEDDDLFGSPAPAPAAPKPAAQKSAPPSPADDDLFGDSSASGGDDDLFGSGGANDDGDAFFSDTQSAKSAPKTTSGGDDSIFDDVPVDAGSATAADTSNETYDEDIEKQLKEKESTFDIGSVGDADPSLTADFGVAGDEIVTMPLDLPVQKASRKELWIGLVITLVVGSIGAAVFLLPGSLHKLPGIGQPIYQLHQTLDTQWYRNHRSSEFVRSVQEHTGQFTLQAAEAILGLAQKNREFITSDAEDSILPHFVLAHVAGRINDDELAAYRNLSGSVGALTRLADPVAQPPAGPHAPLLTTLVAWKQEKFEALPALAAQVPAEAGHDKFLAHLILAESQFANNDISAAVATLGIAAALEPEITYVPIRAAQILWYNLDTRPQVSGRIAGLEEKAKADPLTHSHYLTLKARVLLAENKVSEALQLAKEATTVAPANPDAAAVQAEALNRSGEAIKALLLLEDYGTNYPAHYELKLQTGIGNQSMGRNEKAVEALRAAIDIDVARVEAPIQLTQLYAQIGQFPEATKVIEALVARYPADPRVNRTLGTLYLDMKKFPEAEAAFQKALETDPDNVLILASLGKQYRERRQYSQAQGYLDRALQIKPEDQEVRQELGQVYLAQNDLTRAFEVYQGLLASQPQNAEVLLSLGKIKYLLKEYAASEELLQEAIRNQLSLHEGYYYLSRVYRDTNQAKKAIDAARSAIDNKPELEYRLQLCRAFDADGRPGIAVKEFEAVLKDYPDNPEALREAARLNRLSGKDDSALIHLDKLLTITPDDPQVYADLADIYTLKGENKKAADFVDKGLKRSPNSVKLLTIAANNALQDQNYPTALKTLTRAKNVDPQNARTRMLFGYYYKAKNDLNSAQQEFNRALKLGLDEDNQRIVEGELDALRFR